MITSEFNITIKTIEGEEVTIATSKDELLKIREEIDSLFPREKEIVYVYVPEAKPWCPAPLTPYEPKVWYEDHTVKNY